MPVMKGTPVDPKCPKIINLRPVPLGSIIMYVIRHKMFREIFLKILSTNDSSSVNVTSIVDAP